MRALISGIIGAAASSAAWLAFEHSQQQNYGWMVCLVGLVTGVCVHSGAKSPQGGTMRGALAALLTLAAIVGGQKAYAQWMQNQSTAGQAVEVAAVVTEPAEEPAEDADDAPEAEAPEKLVLPTGRDAVGNTGYSKSALQKNFSEWDMVWMSVAALAAYITGKGGEKPTPVVESEPEPSKPAEPEADSENE